MTVAPAILALVAHLAVAPPWGRLARRDHVIVMGMPGCGKTPFAVLLVADASRVVYWDPAAELREEGEVYSGAELVELVEELGAAGAARELLRGRFLRLVVAPSDELPLAVQFCAVVAMCRAAGELEPGLVLLVDEAGDLRDADEELRRLHANGHKDGIATVLCSPCATDFPKRCRDTASRVYSFRQKNHADRRTLAEEYGEDFATAAATWRFPSPPAAWVSPTLYR